jgi:hypothetical protein
VAFERIAVALLAVAFVSGCKERAAKTELAKDPGVNWRKLPDNSVGWINDNENSVNAERCWKISARYQCIHLWRLNSPGEVALQNNVSVSSFYRDSLQNTNVYPEHGYSCDVMENGTTEELSLVGGAKIQNRMSSLGFTTGSFWSRDFIRKFVMQNSPSTSVVYFKCEAVEQLLQNGNEAAFLTTAISARDLGLAAAP